MNKKDKINKVKEFLANSDCNYSKMFANRYSTRYDDLIETCIKTMNFDGITGINDVADFVIELADQYYQHMASEAISFSKRKF